MHTYNIEDFVSVAGRDIWGKAKTSKKKRSSQAEHTNVLVTSLQAVHGSHPGIVAKHKEGVSDERQSFLGFLFGWMVQQSPQVHPQSKCTSLSDLEAFTHAHAGRLVPITSFEEGNSPETLAKTRALLETLLERHVVRLYPGKHPSHLPLIVSLDELGDSVNSNNMCLIQNNMVVVQHSKIVETQKEYTKDMMQSGTTSSSFPDLMRKALSTVYTRNGVTKMYDFFPLRLCKVSTDTNGNVCLAFDAASHHATPINTPIATVHVTHASIPVAVYWTAELGMHLRLIALKD